MAQDVDAERVLPLPRTGRPAVDSVGLARIVHRRQAQYVFNLGSIYKSYVWLRLLSQRMSGDAESVATDFIPIARLLS
jgi:hypothetical protein